MANEIAPGRDLHVPGSNTGIIHNPASEWSKEARRWEANYTEHGPPGRPYVKREYPTWMFLWGPLPGGGVGVIASEEVPDADRRYAFEQRGFRMEPLEAQKAFDARQLEIAKLAAEREWDKRHRLSPKAVAEVEAVEDAKGSEHLPTIASVPRKRGRPSKLDAAERAKRSTETS